jgi:hypothetical protein
MKGNPHLQGEIISKSKNTQKFLKKIFSRTSMPISRKVSTNHPSVKGIQNCSNTGPSPVQRRDNYKNVKIR